MSGKGSKPRPFSISQDEYAKNFDRIFKKVDNKKSKEDKLKEDWDKEVIMKNEYYDILDTFSALTDED